MVEFFFIFYFFYFFYFFLCFYFLPECGIAESVTEGVDGGVDVAKAVCDIPDPFRNDALKIQF